MLLEVVGVVEVLEVVGGFRVYWKVLEDVEGCWRWLKVVVGCGGCWWFRRC